MKPRVTRGLASQISLCMIVRDEEEFLPGCLESAKGVIDEIVVVDTGSTDRTVDVARGFGAKVHRLQWAGDFAAARNESLKHASCGWILVLDADERLGPGAGAALARIARGDWPKAIYACKIVNRHDPARVTEHIASRFFPNGHKIAYSGVVHERPLPSARRPLAGGPVPRLVEGFVVIHEGYREGVMERRDKHERNMALLEKALAVEENPYYRYKLGATCLELGRVREAVDHLERVARDLGLPARGSAEYSINVHSLLLLSQAHRENGELDASRARAEEAVSICPESRLARYHRGLVLFEAGSVREAREEFDRIVSEAGSEAPCLTDSLMFDPSVDAWKSRTMAARCSLLLGDPVDAARLLAGAAHSHPRNPEYLETVRQTLKRAESARAGQAGSTESPDEDVLRRVLREEADGRKRLADEDFDRGRYAAALRSYAAALALGRPPDGAMLTRVAACLVRTGRARDGLATYLKALRARPADLASLRLLVELARELGAGRSDLNFPQPVPISRGEETS